MRVPDQLLDTTCFLAVEQTDSTKARYSYRGTAFFVSVPSERHPDKAFCYLVTARHCVEAAGHRPLVRLNRRNGGTQMFEVAGDWHFPEDGSDVAVRPWRPDHRDFAFKTIGLDQFLTPEVSARYAIGPGDSLCTVGLFSAHFGEQRNYPIVRLGSIAAMPNEPLRGGTGRPVYIAEMRSIGGLSGSPVFVRLDPNRLASVLGLTGESIFLVGVLQGHWNYPTQGLALAFTDAELQSVNMGMAMVVPSDAIIAAINIPNLAAERIRLELET
jgi:hypothetical protein